MKQLGVIVAVVMGLVLIAGVGSYNTLVKRQEAVQESWAQVQNVLQRRYDLIPNLVNTVKGYAKHEQQLFEEVTRLRSQWASAKTPPEQVGAAQQLEAGLGRLLLVAEQYPELKANQNFLALQDELAGTENRIAVERRRYNDAVRSYNVAVRTFPANIVAGLTGFQPSTAYFDAAKEAQRAPNVQF